ncbi:hypothetical protein G1K60_11510, partial [Tenacibaculum finnmarkense]
KANAPFDSCGRLRKGWKFQNGKPVQVIPKKKATKKAEIKKVVKAVIKKIEKPTKSIKLPSKEIDLKSEIELEDRYIKEVTALLQETRAKSKKTAKDKKNINYWVIAIKEAKKRKSINNKLLKELLQKPTKKTTETFVKPAVKVVKTDTSFKRPGSLPVQLEQVETGMLSARSSLYSWERYLKGVYPSWVEDRYTDDFCLKNIDYFKRLVEAFENQKKMIIKRDRKTTRTVVKPTPIKLGNPKNPENPKKTNSLAYKMANRQNKVSEIYKIRDKNISEFLGEIEVKQKESVVITLTGGQGSMKTRCAFRFMNAFAQKYKVGHASIEEHPESTLYYNKVDEYINDNALNNIHNPEINSISDLDKLVKENDIIVIDSFAKMQEIQKGFEVDKDLRKKYDGKLFIVIFQQTTDGKMRGGSKSQFDADIILFTEKFDNYQDNYIYADKNRYQNKNLTDLKYNIFEGVLKDLE